jgi:hypothetical protein
LVHRWQLEKGFEEGTMFDTFVLTDAIGRFALEAPVAYALASFLLATLAGLASQYLVWD